MMKTSVGKSSEVSSYPSDANTPIQTLSYFIVTVLGFSLWFFMAVPFASHRETYAWLAEVHTQGFAQAMAFISSTYRPLAQMATWLGFLILEPSVFPTSVLRQALLQGFIYGMFVLAWWFIYASVSQRRLFAIVALATGGVFFSGYVHLFHIYGIYYVAVMLMLAALLRFHASRTLDKREVWFAAVATLLAFWHPFATALFIGFYCGFYLDTFRQRTRAQHVQAIAILLIGMMTIAALVVLFPHNGPMPLDTRLFGFLVSYRTNEVNLVASLVAFLLTQMVVFSMKLSLKLKLTVSLILFALSAVFLWKGLPLLLLWLSAILVKLFCARSWSLFFLALVAALFPFGGGIGTPIYALFAIVIGTYVTSLEWYKAEKALSFLKPRYVMTTVVASIVVLLIVRLGIQVPIVTRAASPLLSEREKTYQLENILAWLHNSDYCGYEIAFVDNAGSPIESVESAVARRNRPPAALEDVQLFWKTVLQCHNTDHSGKLRAVVTFGGSALPDLLRVFEVRGRYAGNATVWIRNSAR
jgi:hypothetical protein